MPQHSLPSSEVADVRAREVLIVDDTPETRDVVAIRIEEDPRYTVSKAAGHDEAIAIVDGNPDLLAVFVDQKFGEDDRGGLAILKSIHELRPLLPVVLYTAAPVDDIRREAFDAGALWYLPKVKVSGAEDLKNILEVASKLVDVMPIDTDPRFLKQMLDAVPVQSMVRDRYGHVFWQNKGKEEEFGSIRPGKTYCWHCFEGRKDDPTDKCPEAEEYCPAERVFNPKSDDDRKWPITQIYRYKGGWTSNNNYHPPAWMYIAASGIRGRDDEPEYAVETARDITVQIEVLHLITEIAKKHATSEDEVLKLVTKRLVERMRFARARAWVCDLATREFRCKAVAGYEDSFLLDKPLVFPPEDLRELKKKGEPLRVSRDRLLRVTPDKLKSHYDAAETCLWAPLLVDGEVAGLLSIDKKGQPSERISELDTYWMNFLGQHISSVIERIRTTDELKQRRDNVEWLEKLDRDISGIDSFAEVLRIVIKGLQERLGADLTQFHLLSADGKTIFLAEDNGKHAPDCPMRDGHSAAVGVNGRACRNDESVFLNSTKEDADFENYRTQMGEQWGKVCPACNIRAESMACLPIHTGERVVGCLFLGYADPHNFVTREQDLLTGVCDSLSIALKATGRLSVAGPQVAEARRVHGVQIIARGLTHALRNIAQVISNFTGGVLQDAGDAEKVTQHGTEINKQVGNMTSLFDALARHAAIPAEGPTSPIHQAIQDLVTLQRRRYYDYGISLQSELDPECDNVRKDQDKFLVILLTLLENAFAATLRKEGAREILIKTDLSSERSQVVVTVEDTGVGIAQEKLTRIFDWPSVELSGIPSTHGIGLPVARELARSMGGDIYVESELGVGTTVAVELPLGEAVDE